MAINPVMAALARQTLQQLEPNNAAISQEVTRILGQPAPAPVELPPVFTAWMENHGLPAFPASPEAVALFVVKSQLPLDALCEIAGSISRAHAHTVDPTASWAVRTAFNAIGGKIIPPRSWTGPMKQVFEQLPYHLQRYIPQREQDRDDVARRALNEAGELRRKLKEIENQHAEKTEPTPDAA